MIIMRLHEFVGLVCAHGRSFGIVAVTSISSSIPPANSPSRTQSSACHQSS